MKAPGEPLQGSSHDGLILGEERSNKGKSTEGSNVIYIYSNYTVKTSGWFIADHLFKNVKSK